MNAFLQTLRFLDFKKERLFGVISCLLLGNTVLCAEELIGNGGFETPKKSTIAKTSQLNGAERNTGDALKPEVWNSFSAIKDQTEGIELTVTKAHQGQQSVKMSMPANTDNFQGLLQEIVVQPNMTYRYSAYVRNDKEAPIQVGSRGQLSIEWVTEDGTEIGRQWGPIWGSELSSRDWERQELTSRSPGGAARARFVITQFGSTNTVAQSAFFVDDVSATPYDGDTVTSGGK